MKKKEGEGKTGREKINLISVILPTYNERKSIPLLVKEIHRQLGSIKHEIIIVDDLSPDGTWKIAQELAKKHDYVRAEIRKKEKGLATAIGRGIEISKGDVVVLLDTDFSHPPKVIPRLVKGMGRYDMVIASRYVNGGSMDSEWYKFYLSKLLNYFIKFTLGLKICDSTGGFFAIRKKVLDKVNKRYVFKGYGDYFFKLAYLLKGKKSLNVREIPFRYERRRYGTSKTDVLDVGLSYILQALRIRLKGGVLLRLFETGIKNARRYITFIFGGFLGALLNWTVTYVLTEFAKLWYLFSFMIACICTIIFNFTFHMHITFGVKDAHLKRFTRFIGVYLAIFGLSVGSVYMLTSTLNVYYMFSIIATTIVISIVNFALNKRFVFKNAKKKRVEKH